MNIITVTKMLDLLIFFAVWHLDYPLKCLTVINKHCCIPLPIVPLSHSLDFLTKTLTVFITEENFFNFFNNFFWTIKFSDCKRRNTDESPRKYSWETYCNSYSFMTVVVTVVLTVVIHDLVVVWCLMIS